MKITFLFFFLLTSFICWSALAEVELHSLYHADALVTGRFLPFQMKDQDNLLSVSEVTTAEGCHTMVDPYRNSIIHLYCTTPGSKSLEATASDGSKIAIENIVVRQLSIVEPTTPEEPTDPSTAAGAKVFANDCAACHPVTPIRRPLDIDTLKAALNRSPMADRGLNTKFDSNQALLENLLRYINEDL